MTKDRIWKPTVIILGGIHKSINIDFLQNMRVMSKYYSRITLNRIANLLEMKLDVSLNSKT